MSPEFESSFLYYAALSFDKQLNMANVIGERGWSADLDAGTLAFGEQGSPDSVLEFDIQVLGSAAEGSATWMWAWANPSIPDNLSLASTLLRDKVAIPEFATQEFPINFDSADEHRIAMTCGGYLNADAYYRGPFPGGAAFFLIRDPRLQLAAPDIIHISTLFPQLISALSVSDHRAAFMNYLERWQIQAQVEGDEVRVAIANSSLTAHFDGQNRLSNMEVNARP
ncbi:hypothetical protein EON83_16535 [bacterium]|nr:MAG: hypothetical protein EON83_16535 [bacterium]